MKRWLVIIGCCVLWNTATAQEILLTVALDSSGTGSATSGKGTGTMILSSDRLSLRYHFVVNKLAGAITAAHFHYVPTGAPVQAITFTGNEAVGSWTFPDSMFDHLFSERIYVNVHTTAVADGEIRGFPRPQQYGFRIDLDGTQAGTASAGKGVGYVRVETNGGAVPELQYRVTYSGLSGTITAAHFHALPGGGVVHAVTFTDSTSEGVWTSPPDSIWWKLVQGQIYLNVHSSFAGGGEIRGSTQPVGEAPFVARLDGAQAGTASPGQGVVWAVLRPDRSILYNATYNRLQGAFSASHFHESRTGSVVHAVNFVANHAAGSWASPGDQSIADLFQGRMYLNVHSSTNTGGEIRGTLAFSDGVVTGELTGAAAGTVSTGKGTIWGRFREDSLEYAATIAGLTGAYTGSHFHLSPSGTVLAPIPLADSCAFGHWRYDNNFIQLLRGNVYFNVHSTIFTGGELRANLKVGTGIATHVDVPERVVPEAFQLAQNFPNPFNPTTSIEYSIAQTGRVSLHVYNLLGQKVAILFEGIATPGVYRSTFDAAELPTGIYFYRLSGENASPSVRRMMLVR